MLIREAGPVRAETRLAKHPKPAPGPAAAVAADRAEVSPPARLQVGTYNLGAGNAGARQHFDETTRQVSEQVTGGGLDVVAFQEVDVGAERTGRQDYNEEVLKDVFRAESGPNWSEAESVDKFSLDEHGQPVVDEQGHRVYDPVRYDRTQYEADFGDHREQQVVERVAQGADHVVYESNGASLVVSKESYDEHGQPYLENGRRAFDDSNDTPITVYSAEIEKDGAQTDYTVVFGSSLAHSGAGTYGNAVLLGPEAQLRRDAQGEIEPGSLRRHDLGANDPDNENRTALAVGFEAGGQEATFVSTHFTSGGDEADQQARVTQYQTLGDIVEGYGDHTIVAGDFNSKAGGRYLDFRWRGLLPDNPVHHYPSADSLGWSDPDADNSIDRIYTSHGSQASGRHRVEGGGSDHELVRWDVTV
ncbi:MAG: endonuclease/exonuclease/phosphatase family protein [Vulcanimicrobiota bacterium]